MKTTKTSSLVAHLLANTSQNRHSKMQDSSTFIHVHKKHHIYIYIYLYTYSFNFSFEQHHTCRHQYLIFMHASKFVNLFPTLLDTGFYKQHICLCILL